MYALAVLRIIEATLNLATATVEGMSPEQKQAFWARHEQRMERLDSLLDKFKDRD
jgi:hypothetical protein